MMCYYVPLRAGSRKNFNSPDHDFWCCTGTGVENHGKYGDSIYFHNASQLYLNQFIASELNWKEKGLQIRQETVFPQEEQSRLTLHCASPVTLEIKIRHPGWARAGFEIRVNGEQMEPGNPGSYAAIQRQWKDGDGIEIKMPFALHEEGFADRPQRVAVMDGPLVLAAAIDVKKPRPAIVGEPESWLGQLTPFSGGVTPSFTAAVFHFPGDSQPESLTLQPFYKIYQSTYQVYWDLLTPAQWQVMEKDDAAEKEKLRLLEARTVDFVQPGDEINERAHHQQGEKSGSGDFGDHSYRDASEGGWFSWDLKSLPDQREELVLTYWGADNGRHFDILIDGEKLATERLTASHPEVFFDQVYPLPPALTKGKQHLTLRLQGGDTWVGGVFGARLLKAPDSP
jgi:hypothetical protein